MDVTYTDTKHVDVGELVDPTLDLAFGENENDFELTHADPELILQPGSLVSVDGTEYGGIVDSTKAQVENGVTTVTWSGRTWHGILAGKILSPDSGQDRLTVSGDVHTILSTIIKRIGLSGLFSTPDGTLGTTVSGYSFRRYINAYDGLRMMLTSVGLRLAIARVQGVVRLTGVPIAEYTGVDPDIGVDFTVKRDWLRVNHLVGLGKGTLKNRAVSHWYADKNGTVSQKQSLTGVDEICEAYEQTSSEGTELANRTRDKLRELQTNGEMDVTIPETASLGIDDRVKAVDQVTGISVTASITKKVVKIKAGIESVDYAAGAVEWPDEQD